MNRAKRMQAEMSGMAASPGFLIPNFFIFLVSVVSL